MTINAMVYSDPLTSKKRFLFCPGTHFGRKKGRSPLRSKSLKMGLFERGSDLLSWGSVRMGGQLLVGCIACHTYTFWPRLSFEIEVLMAKGKWCWCKVESKKRCRKCLGQEMC